MRDWKIVESSDLAWKCISERENEAEKSWCFCVAVSCHIGDNGPVASSWFYINDVVWSWVASTSTTLKHHLRWNRSKNELEFQQRVSIILCCCVIAFVFCTQQCHHNRVVWSLVRSMMRFVKINRELLMKLQQLMERAEGFMPNFLLPLTKALLGWTLWKMILADRIKEFLTNPQANFLDEIN